MPGPTKKWNVGKAEVAQWEGKFGKSYTVTAGRQLKKGTTDQWEDKKFLNDKELEDLQTVIEQALENA